MESDTLYSLSFGKVSIALGLSILKLEVILYMMCYSEQRPVFNRVFKHMKETSTVLFLHLHGIFETELFLHQIMGKCFTTTQQSNIILDKCGLAWLLHQTLQLSRVQNLEIYLHNNSLSLI